MWKHQVKLRGKQKMKPKNKKIIIIFFLAVIAGGYLTGNLLFNDQKNEATTPSSDAYFSSSSNFSIPKAFSIDPPKSFAELAKKVKPAVVNISTTKEIKGRSYNQWGALDPFFRDFFGPYYQTQPPKQEHHSLGTGFIINKQGDIITNNHVVEGADEIIVRLDDERKLEAKIIGRDTKLDIAILRPTKKDSYPFATLGDSDNLNVGDWVVAVGNPFGLGQTVTAGIVSAKARVLGAGPYDDFIQTDASINPGNSGGPLFNVNGEVVGINTAIVASGQGIGFAIPINMAKDIIPQLISKGKVSRGWLGVAIRDVNSDEAEKLGLKKPEGAYVTESISGGPADQAGIKTGDIILEFNGEGIGVSHMLPTLVAKIPPGGEATVTILQNGKKDEKKVTLGSLENPQASLAPSSIESKGLFGMSVHDLSPAQREQFRAGVIVIEVESGSMAESVGIRQGDLLLEINGAPIGSVKELKKILKTIQSGEVMRIGLARGQYMYYFAFRKE